jgi:hypothetical protein
MYGFYTYQKSQDRVFIKARIRIQIRPERSGSATLFKALKMNNIFLYRRRHRRERKDAGGVAVPHVDPLPSDIVKVSVEEPHHFDAAPAPGKNCDAVPAAPGPGKNF